MLAGCAAPDPYKRLEPAPTPELTGAQAGEAFDGRWPEQFKSVQTVTIDFGLATRTLVGYLIVQQPGQFRLQGMTEQGIKLFDVIGNAENWRLTFEAEEMDFRVIASIARDIRRVYLSSLESVLSPSESSLGTDEYSTKVRALDDGSRARFAGKHGDLAVNLVGTQPSVDWYEYLQSDRALYRVDHYEWQDFGGTNLPSTVVLHEPGIQSMGPPYKLTIKITELTVRDKPWPAKLFEVGEGE